jgi:hypothetical protein
MVREVAESCVDGVVMEMVAAYCGRFYAAKPELAARRIEAIGFQVGHQLSERYARNSSLRLPDLRLQAVTYHMWFSLIRVNLEMLILVWGVQTQIHPHVRAFFFLGTLNEWKFSISLLHLICVRA